MTYTPIPGGSGGGGGGGGGAPDTATYLTLSSDATLTNERILTMGAGLSAVDGGPGGAYTISAGGGGTAPSSASFLTLATNATLTSERVLTAGTNISFVDAGAGSTLTINASGGGGGAPTTSQYVTLATDATLTNERVLTAGTGISIVDAGAGSTVTISNTGAPVAAQYLTLATDATLSNERVLTAGTNISFVDGGAGSTLTINASGGGAAVPITNNLFPIGNGSTIVDSTLALTSGLLDNTLSRSGGSVGLLVSNTSNTASSSATITAQVAGATAANPALVLAITGGRTWTVQGLNSATGDPLEIFDGTNARIAVDASNGVAINKASGGAFSAGYNLMVYGNGGTGTAKMVSYTSTNNASAEVICQTSGGAYLSNYAAGLTVAGTAVFGALTSAGLAATFQNSVVGGASVYAMGTMSNIPVHVVTNNTVKLTVRADGNVIIGPTITSGAEATSIGTGAAGVVYIKNGTIPTTAPTGGLVMGSLSGHLTVAGATGVRNILTGAQNEVSDVDVTVTLADRATVHTGTLTANRAVTLPAAASTPNGFRHRVLGPTNMGGFTLTVSGDINIQGAASFPISAADTNVEFEKCTATWRALD